MLEDENPSLSRVNYWAEKFEETLNEQVALLTATEAGVDSVRIRESYIINKLAVLTVANEMLGERLRKLEEKLGKSDPDLD